MISECLNRECVVDQLDCGIVYTVVSGICIGSIYGKRPRRCVDIDLPREICHFVGRSEFIVFECERTDVFRVVNTGIVKVKTVFFNSESNAARCEYRMFVSPASLSVCCRRFIYAVFRCYLRGDFVKEGIACLRIISLFKMPCQNIVITSVRVTGGLVEKLTAILIRNRNVFALSLHFDCYKFCIRIIESIREQEIIALSRGNLCADFPDEIIILTVIICGFIAP